ncbi:MAG: TIR domain-containing protein [Marinicaulis sp.]|nr:TIR domain-containing protein [Marinicaulis sp.]
MTQETPSKLDETDGGGRRTTVFFSYAHANRERAIEIIQALEKAGYAVWWDGVLEGGVKYSENIEQALESANAVVVLWSEDSIKSHWVRDEASRGVDRNCLVPLTIDGVKPPLGFRQFQIINMTNWQGEAGAIEAIQMVRAVAAFHGDAQSAPALPTGATTAIQSIKRRRLLIGGGAAAAAFAIGIAMWRPDFGGSKLLAENGIVVLPFDNVSGDPQQNFMSAGLAAELRAALARNHALRVIAGSSSEALKNRKLDAVSIARELGVAYVLEGSIRVAGEAIRVSSELIDGKSGFSRWSDIFEQTLNDSLNVQQNIANAVSSALSVELPTAGAGVAIGAPTNSAAYIEYLKGIDLYKSAVSTETDLRSLSHLDSATQLDPNFAAAHAARARTLTVLGNTSDNVRRAKLYYATALEAAQKAASLGPELDDAHSTLGFVLFQTQLKVKEAREPYERSRELGEGSATVLARYSTYAALTGQDKAAMDAATRAVSLDPLNPVIHRALGLSHYAAERYREAIDAVEDALALNPKLGDAHAMIGAALLQMDNLDDAIAACEKETFRLSRHACLAIAHWQNGDKAAAKTSFDELIDQYSDAGLYQQAQVLAQWQRPDDAMATLNAAFNAGDSGLVYLKTDPMLTQLRERADFISLQSTLGFA